MNISKKTILISVGSILVVGLLVAGGLWLLAGGSKDPQADTRKEGDVVAIADTPDLKTCDVLSVDTIQPIFGDTAKSFSNGERAGSVSQNLKNADVCAYTFTTSSSVKSNLILQTYAYSSDDASANTNIFDTSWRNIDPIAFPEWNTGYPAYYKQKQQGSDTSFILEVLNGARYYHFEIVQPTSQVSYTDKTAPKLLVQLALKADYTVANDPEAPPAPPNATAKPPVIYAATNDPGTPSVPPNAVAGPTVTPERVTCEVNDTNASCPPTIGSQPVSTTQ